MQNYICTSFSAVMIEKILILVFEWQKTHVGKSLVLRCLKILSNHNHSKK